jgi:hypothetical protein
MANFPVRDMGGLGIISDIHPYDLPPNALSSGVNIRFENQKISRGPVMRRVAEFDTHEPAYMFAIPEIAGGGEALVTVSSDFTEVLSTVGSTVTDVTPAAVVPASSEASFTHTFLGNVAYLNHRSNVPYQKTAADETFEPLTAWDSDDRCVTLRSYKDFLIALNVTKGAIEYPTMVKWSDPAAYGNPPASWDEESTEGSAGENVVNEMVSPLVDGLSLRDSFILYCKDEVWIMDYIGGNFLFRFRKIYESVGAISQNCVVQVDGLHYVFDRNDIYAHDGATKRSIIHGKNKDFVFNSLIQKFNRHCFVSHDPRLNEIHFCYPSADQLVGFGNPTTGCNRAAVYNYRRDTWSFYDMPNVTGSAVASVTTGLSYEQFNELTYDDVGGSFLGDDDDQALYSLFCGRTDAGMGLSKARVYGLDLMVGGKLLKPIEPEALKDAFFERIGIDMDETGAELTSYKVIQAIYPQLGLLGEVPVYFQFGASDIVGEDPVWGPLLPYDPRLENKVDTREPGRYLAYRMYYSGNDDFAFSGLDAKVTKRGRR